MPPSIVIFGPPGAPVHEVATGVGERLAQPVRDTDADLARRAGRTAAEVMVDLGEHEFRRCERVAVREAIAEHPGVLVIGGGAVGHTETRAELVAAAGIGTVLVFVDTDIAQAARRLGFATGPSVAINPRAAWLAMMRERRALYQQVATVTVGADLTTPAAIEQLLASLPGAHSL
jgi:shikimate kinase